MSCNFNFLGLYISREETVTKNNLEMTKINSIDEESVPFQLVLNPFLMKILQKDLPEKGSLDPEEVLALIDIYKSQYHPNLSVHFFRQLKHAPNQNTARKIFDEIVHWEFQKSGHTSKKEAIECILNQAGNDLELKKWILDMLDWGIFSRFKQFLQNLAPGLLENNRSLTIMDYLKSAIQTICSTGIFLKIWLPMQYSITCPQIFW